MKAKKTIIISPFSRKLRNGKNNAKNYPWWNELIEILKANGYHVVQLGIHGEDKLKRADEYKFDLSLIELYEYIKNNNILSWFSVDNFFPHFIHSNKLIPGFVIFGRSDPDLFGYEENINILKDIRYLRLDQYGPWEVIPFNKEVFLEPEKIFTIFNDFIPKEKKNGV